MEPDRALGQSNKVTMDGGDPLLLCEVGQPMGGDPGKSEGVDKSSSRETGPLDGLAGGPSSLLQRVVKEKSSPLGHSSVGLNVVGSAPLKLGAEVERGMDVDSSILRPNDVRNLDFHNEVRVPTVIPPVGFKWEFLAGNGSWLLMWCLR